MRIGRPLHASLTAATMFAIALTSAPRAHARGITCDFSDPGALNRLFRQARGTFAEWTKSNGAGGFTGCTAPYETGCWNWVQDENTFPQFPFPGQIASRTYARLRVEAADNQHFHLAFEDPAVGQCFALPNPDDGLGSGLGSRVNGVCKAPNWGSAPRYAMTHDAGKTISVWVEGMSGQATFGGMRWSSTGPRLFDLVSFRNRGDVPVTLRVKWYDGSWWDWENIGPGVHDMSGWAYWILEARFFATGSAGIISLDDIVTENIQLD
jgi:hypothetical protein